jgi:SAM-dependent methyltransferase
MASPVLIEMKPGDPVPDAPADSGWQQTMQAAQRATPLAAQQASHQVDKEFLQEKHHQYYGRPWVLGKYIFQYAVSRGLQPEHKLLDCGCGSGRFAIWAIRYLGAGNYHGIDIHRRSLEALTTYEIPLHSLEDKRPRLLHNGRCAFGYFGVQFDWAFDCFVSFHFPTADQRLAFFGNLGRAMKKGGRLLCLPQPKLSPAELREAGFVLDHQGVQACPMLDGHDYVAQNEWFEYVRV